MDQELATAVLARWNNGQPVTETVFHKAASVLGLNPDDALLEARYYTMLDHDLAKVASGGVLTDDDLIFYAFAAGDDPRVFAKTASAYHLDPQELILEKLAQCSWVPDLGGLKLAMTMAGGQGGMMMDQMGAMADPAAGGIGGEANAGMPGPIPDQAVQQAPQQRFKPSPMAPAQVPPSKSGNLQELARQAMEPSPPSQDMMGGMGLGAPGTDMAPTTPAPPPPTPEEKLQQVVPDLPPETMQRYSQKLQEVEQRAGIPIEDPNQVQKFVAQMRKQDDKIIDEAIKNIGEAPPLRSLNADGHPQEPMPSSPQQPPQVGAEKVASVARQLARGFTH
jgi:hypothetical protein